MANVHVGDIGTSFQASAVDENGAILNISTATSLLLNFLKPDGTSTLSKTATLVTDGTDGLYHYVTIAGDIDQAGTWSVQGVVTLPAGEYHGDIVKVKVKPNILPG